ncbi:MULTISPECIES: DsbA family protein [Actinomadura]|uniref:DsbA family protein n=1 Tax=Actinomadura yumaensis TaxID=111807 RepID=A0ABW2CYV8_9ACTN|nr:thioredoxin domain-containing protein [Actinomadura sp. J1-007]MWK32704.1 thioredoxin domain-containing protein [Actinomadura sp. J1-007]
MSKAARERSARERLAAERKRQAARDKQRRLLAIVLGAVVAVAVVVVAAVLVLNREDKGGQTASAHTGQLAPVTREADGSVVMAKQGVTKPVLEIFEDFQCPICKQMEETTGKTVQQLALEGKAKVVYRPFHLFGQQRDPVKTNSLRSAAAALCVPADKWVSYHDALFKFQPEEGSKGFAPKDLAKWGKDVGVTDPGFEKCVTDMQKKPQVDAMTKYALQDRKVEGTPTVFLDGKQLDLQSQIMNPKALEAAVTAASGK